jgi:hypothetical protein
MAYGDTAAPSLVDGLDRSLLLSGPSGFCFDLDDALQIDSLCSLAGVAFTVSGVMLDAQNKLKAFEFTHTPNSTRTLATTRQAIGSGWLLRVRVTATSGAPLLGQAYVWLRVCRGLTSSARINGTIINGYLTASTDVNWPSGVAQQPLDGEGVPLSISVAQPAAGADWSQTVPTGARWKVVAATAQLATAAAVATRLARLVIDDGTTPIFEAPAAASQAASLSVLYTYGQGAGGPVTADAAVIEGPIPNDAYLPAGFRIRSSTGAIQAADQWSAIRLLVQEWLEGN